MYNRPRRNRKTSAIREMVSETSLSVNNLIYPLFVLEGTKQKVEITSMPGQYRFSLDLLLEELKSLEQLGINNIALFPVIEDSLKDPKASEALNEGGLYIRSLAEVKKHFPKMTLMTDIALDPYSSDGHDGLVNERGEILNDETNEILAQMGVLQAQAGADILGPSDMMDGRVAAIREALEDNGLGQTSIMSYTAKYASSFYGPFRDALDSAPRGGDKKTYQMDFRNSREAIREAMLDEQEGADILMVKPGLAYLDIITQLKMSSSLPIAAYNVSGEYSMVHAAAAQNWIDLESCMLECLTSFRRAGADIILSYFTKQAAPLLN